MKGTRIKLDGTAEEFDITEEKMDRAGIQTVEMVAEIRAVDFMQLFTKQERIAIRKSDDEDVQDFYHLALGAASFPLAHPFVTQGLGLLVVKNLITAERRDQIAAGTPPA
jgi:hypothetical protein